jgi:hypothetical protein
MKQPLDFIVDAAKTEKWAWEDVTMREISVSLIAVGAMMVALVWSLMQEPPHLESVSRPLPTIASTVGAGSIQNSKGTYPLRG